MMCLRSFVVAGGSLLLLQVGATLSEPGPGATQNETSHTAQRVDCFSAMNAARTKAGLPDFAAPKEDKARLPIVGSAPSQSEGSVSSGGSRSDPLVPESTAAQTAQTAFLKDFCEKLETVGDGVKEQQNHTNGTYMYATEAAGNVGNCTAAVDHWKKAMNNFSSLPPSYTTEQTLYSKHENVSFVALFNPATNATVDCAAITCKTEKAKARETHQLETKPSTEEVTSHSLLCLSSPPALKQSEPPFTQTQWDKITGVESSSTQLNWLGALAIAAAALGHALL